MTLAVALGALGVAAAALALVGWAAKIAIAKTEQAGKESVRVAALAGDNAALASENETLRLANDILEHARAAAETELHARDNSPPVAPSSAAHVQLRSKIREIAAAVRASPTVAASGSAERVPGDASAEPSGAPGDDAGLRGAP